MFSTIFTFVSGIRANGIRFKRWKALCCRKWTKIDLWSDYMMWCNRWSSTPSKDPRAWQPSTCIRCTQPSSSTSCCRQQPCSSTSTPPICRVWPPYNRSDGVCLVSHSNMSYRVCDDSPMHSRLRSVRDSHLRHPAAVWFISLLVFPKTQ